MKIIKYSATIAVVIALLPTALANFSDVSQQSPYAESIAYVQSEGIVSGYADGTYKPNALINRAEFTKILIEAQFESSTISQCDTATIGLRDVALDAWYAPYVCIATEAGIIEGYNDNTFKPSANINLAEAAKIIVAMNEGAMNTSPWYKGYIESLADKKAIPVEITKPDSLLTRGQMAEIMFRVFTELTTKSSKTYQDLTDIAMTGDTSVQPGSKLATFAGGCFWCMEPPYQEHPNVTDAVVGYAEGPAETATYSQVARGNTKHREAVQVTYNPMMISYEELLELFWKQIDPTDEGGQFADRGFQYTTAIYYHDESQKSKAESAKAELEASGKFDEPIVTKILPYSTFFPAEEYHQEYYKKSSDHYERYKKGSGRAGFIEENWAKDAALEYADAQDHTKYELTDVERNNRRNMLDEVSYDVIVNEGTEKPYDNEYEDLKADGVYVDKISGEPLYSSTHKFDSGTGWPSFWRAIDDSFIVKKEDKKLFVTRTELRSKYGDSHLGHLFNDGPKDKTGLRHCINSASLIFIPKENMEKEGYGKYLYLFE